MHFFTFIACSLVIVLVVTAEPIQDLPHNDFYMETGECIPNQGFIDKCNRCYCGADGKKAACTMMACQTPEKPHIDGFSSIESFSCHPGKVFYDNCNTCICSKSGSSAICTLAECQVKTRNPRSIQKNAPVALSNYPHIDNFSESGECTPGQLFYDKCNVCHCSIDGKSAGCTRMACPGYDKIFIDNYVEGSKCPAGKTFYNKCNTCTCSANGVSAFCTLMACPNFE